MNLDKETAEERLNSPKNIADFLSGSKSESKVATITMKREGTKEGSKNLPPSAATAIAIMSRARLDKQENIGAAFGVTQERVSKIKNGKATKSVDEKKVEEATGVIKDRALDRLMTALGLLDNDKLANCKATDLSMIAANMGKVYDRISPKIADQNVNLVIYAPELRKEKHYKTITVESSVASR